jgi:hypothetical protein
MKNVLLSNLLLLGLAFWSTGCYSNRELTRLDPRDYPLDVLTKGNTLYIFEKQWDSDNSGLISGIARWKLAKASEPLELRGRVKCPADSIASAFVGESEIEVVTKGESHITLTNWMSDAMGGIYGLIRQRNPEYSAQNWQVPEYFVHRRGIPVDSIASIQRSEFSPSKTALLVGTGVVATAVVAAGAAVGRGLAEMFGRLVGVLFGVGWLW